MRLLAFWIVSLVAGAVIPAVALQTLPEGDGRPTVVEQCSFCHGIESVASRKQSREEWSNVIARMAEHGAKMDEKQRTIVLDYLAKYLGAPAIDPETEKTATRYIEGICASCHTSELIKTTTATKTEWMDIVKGMNGKGAGLSDVDVQLLADYLFLKYPAK